MFGTYRTYLALMVFWGHLLQLSGLGQYAVFGFYTLSGYLMTTIMSRSYGYTREGRTRYLINRFLRIYPVWWCSLAIAVSVLAIVGKERSTMFHSSMYLPSDFPGWLQNISLVFPSMTPIECSPRISPSIWALTVELFFYALICLGISKSRRTTSTWFLLSCGYVIYTYWAGLSFGSRYFPILAASLPFSIGSLIFHYPRFMGNLKSNPWLLIAILPLNWLLFVKVLTVKLGYSWSSDLGLYLNLAVNAIILSLLSRKELPYVSKASDKWLGGFSYTLYLLHWPIALAVYATFLDSPIRTPWFEHFGLTLVALLICLLISETIRMLVENPIEKIRNKIKTRAKDSTPPASQSTTS